MSRPVNMPTSQEAISNPLTEAPDFMRKWEDIQPEITDAINLILPGIEEGRWTSLIADDSRGRVPAILMRRVMSRAYVRRGFKPPVLHFVAGSRHAPSAEDLQTQRQTIDAAKASDIPANFGYSSVEALQDADEELSQHEAVHTSYKDYISLMKPIRAKSRALIITEMVSCGRNTGQLLTRLYDQKIKADVLAFAVSKNADLLDNVDSKLIKKIQKDVTLYCVTGGPLFSPNKVVLNPTEVPYGSVFESFLDEIKGPGIDIGVDHPIIAPEGQVRYPLDKEGIAAGDSEVYYRGSQIPVAKIHDMALYRTWRPLFQQLADTTYSEVFVS